MHVFMIDETNKNPVPGDFFVVGGLAFTDAQIAQVHESVTEIRRRHGYQPSDNLKFQTSARPKHVSIDAATQAKQDVIQALSDHGVRMIVYVLLHDIGISQGERNRMAYAINTLASTYHKLLRLENASGLFLIDRDDHQYPLMEDIFRNGVGAERKFPLSDRIHLFGQSANGASNLSSAVDIALGGFRFCVNHATRSDQLGPRSGDVAKTIFSGLSNLLWGESRDGMKYIGGRGYIERPQTPPYVASYRIKYEELRSKLMEYGSSPEGNH